ncbi:hypothetical protein QBC39DRAFT_65801 [Podospora conica]|nr:hypothetical protein QBC39DRAFT_65801 [Schizothecium conicum]
MEVNGLPIVEADEIYTYAIDGFRINGQRREEGSHLRKLFLPLMTRAAKKLLRRCPDFVFNQFEHYNIEYDESEFAGSDVTQLKRALAAGKLDRVPPEMQEVENSMELNWLAALSPMHLAGNPELFVQKRFLGPSGTLAPQKLDAAKLVTVEYSSIQGDLAAKLVHAANKVQGLYAISARSEPHHVFISRNENLVRAAAGITDIRDARLLKLAKEISDVEEQHKRLLDLASIAADTEHRHATLLDSATYSPSPIGRYNIDAPTFNGVTCPDPRRLSLRISALETDADPRHRVFQGTFDFRVAKGVMIISPSLRTLYTFCRQKWGDNVRSKAREYDSDDSDDPDDTEDSDPSDSSSQPTGSKRRAAPAGTARARKRAKRARTPLKYHALLRYRETRTDVIHHIAEGGVLKFVDEEQLEFSARVDLSAYLGLKVEMTGRKV